MKMQKSRTSSRDYQRSDVAGPRCLCGTRGLQGGGAQPVRGSNERSQGLSLGRWADKLFAISPTEYNETPWTLHIK